MIPPRMTDVVVVGGGLAGLACALRCTEKGLSVLVLEAGDEPDYPCNSRIAMGFFNVAMRDVKLGPAVLRQAIMDATRNAADPALAETLAERAPRSLAWLRRQGIRLVVGGHQEANRAMLIPPAALRPGLHWKDRGANLMMRRLEANLAARGGEVARGARVLELVMDLRRCAGVVVMHDGVRRQVVADSVVLADGGFQCNAELLRRYVSPAPDRLLQRNAGSGRGEGLMMAQAVGAKLTPMDRFYGHVHARDAMTNPELWPYPTVDVLMAGIVVDHEGRRFADEGLGGVAMANAIARLADPLEAVAVFDHATWMGAGNTSLLPPNPYLVRQGATMWSAHTMAALARKAGVSPTGLPETVLAHNNAPRHRTPPRSGLPAPITTPPFYAVPLCAGITYTMGGIAIDGAGRVCRVGGGVIPGLYAAGSVTGGHEGGVAAGYTGGLMKALAFGLVAADTIGAEQRVSGAA